MCPSFLTGDQYSLIQARLIDRLADSAEGSETLLATLALVEEVSDRLFDQFVGAPIVAASEFLLDLFCQIRRQRYIHDRLLSFILRVHSAITMVTVEGAAVPEALKSQLGLRLEQGKVHGQHLVIDHIEKPSEN